MRGGYAAVMKLSGMLSSNLITRIDKDAIPFCWYKTLDHVIVAQDDPDWERHRHELSIYASG